jgi:hypothetical protein
MHFISTQQFKQAADAAIYHAREEQRSVSTAQTLLSIAKLSALVSAPDEDDGATHTAQAVGVHPDSRGVFAEPVQSDSHSEAYNEACRGLALIQSQKTLEQKIEANPMYVPY